MSGWIGLKQNSKNNEQSFMIVRPYLIVPKLIPQPTWGGQYIAEFKSISDSSIMAMNIGQSYELSADTMLSTITDSSKLPIEIGDPKTGKTTQVIGDASSMFPLQELIDQNPQAVLGKKYLEKYEPTMEILIKFTQAKGNSFQVHVRPNELLGHWKPKPESWYFFEKGKATLGLLDPTPERIKQYKNICFEIENAMKQFSVSLLQKQKTLEDVKKEIQQLLTTNNPYQFVNSIEIEKDTVIDLSNGGIHHSWEEGLDIPQGNIVYEVQRNVMDNDCTLRSFDKGKIGEDGSIRPIHVDDYFQALDTDSKHNDPKALVRQSSTMLFDSQFYKTGKITFQDSEKHLFSPESFQHFFIKEGSMEVGVDENRLSLSKGSSVFVPSDCVEDLQIHSGSQVLHTFI